MQVKRLSSIRQRYFSALDLHLLPDVQTSPAGLFRGKRQPFSSTDRVPKLRYLQNKVECLLPSH